MNIRQGLSKRQRQRRSFSAALIGTALGSGVRLAQAQTGASAGTAAAPAASAAGARRSYAVVSELAHTVAVVQYQPATGSRLDTNAVDRILIPDRALDKAALLMVRQALAKADPQAPVWLVAPLDEDLYPGMDAPFIGSRMPVAEDLAEEMKTRRCTHLLVVTPQRAEAAFQFSNMTVGTGSVRGLGFYLDNSASVKDLDSLNTRPGFMAPFASLRVSAIDVASRQLVASKSAFRYQLSTVAGSAGSVLTSWSTMTAQQKVRSLTLLTEAGIGQALKELLPAL